MFHLQQRKRANSGGSRLLSLTSLSCLLNAVFIMYVVVFSTAPPSSSSTSSSSSSSSSCPKTTTTTTSSSTVTTTTTTTTHLEFPPEVKGVIINVGSNDSPPIPPDTFPNRSVAVIAFEPNLSVAAKIKKNSPHLYVIPCAISGESTGLGLVNFRFYAEGGVASSLGMATSDDAANHAKHAPRSGSVFFVPAITLKQVLDSIPPHIDVLAIKLDMQGFDLEGIKSGGESLARAFKICAEVDKYGNRHYEGTHNDLLLDWMPYLTREAPEGVRGVFSPAARVPGFLARFPKGHYDGQRFPKEGSNNADFANWNWTPKNNIWGGSDLHRLWATLNQCRHCACG